MNTFKKLYISCLLVFLLFTIIDSFLNFLEEHTYFEETVGSEASFPSFTICRRQFWADNFTTFLDVMEEIRGHHRQAETLLIYDGKHFDW